MKTKPYLLWTILWVLGVFFITIKNRIVADVGLQWGEVFTLNIIMSIIVIPVALITYFIMVFVLRLVGGSSFLEGKNGLRNTAIIWLVLYILVYAIPLFM